MPAPPVPNRRFARSFIVSRLNFGMVQNDRASIDTYPTPAQTVLSGGPQLPKRTTVRVRRENAGYPYRTQEVVLQMGGEDILDMARMLHEVGVATIEAERLGNA